jgi:hypothetical protein
LSAGLASLPQHASRSGKPTYGRRSARPGDLTRSALRSTPTGVEQAAGGSSQLRLPGGSLRRSWPPVCRSLGKSRLRASHRICELSRMQIPQEPSVEFDHVGGANWMMRNDQVLVREAIRVPRLSPHTSPPTVPASRRSSDRTRDPRVHCKCTRRQGARDRGTDRRAAGQITKDREREMP